MNKRFSGILALLLPILLASACAQTPVTPTSAPPPTATLAASETPLPPTNPPPTDTQPPPPSLTPSETPAESPTEPPPPTASPAPVENPIPPLVSGQEVFVTAIRMFDETTGWAIGGLSENGDHILTTADGGQTWRDVTPPEPAPAGDEPQKVANAYFLDANTAWVTYYYTERYFAPRGPVVWRTTDRGQTWQPGEPLETDSFFLPLILSEPMQFSDAQHGWLLENLHDAGMGHNYVMLYRSTDGGAAWERIIEPMDGFLQTAGKTAMAFADAQTGIVTYDQGAYVSVFVDWTFDGGLTWEQQFLPPPESNPALLETAFCTSYSPVFFSPSSLSLAVECVVYSENGSSETSYYLYATGDAGQSWNANPFPGGTPQFTSPDVVWALSRDIYRSDDGGQTWALVKTVNWDGQFSFVNETVGWAVARADGEIALVQTTNGGQRWEIIEPKIAP